MPDASERLRLATERADATFRVPLDADERAALVDAALTVPPPAAPEPSPVPAGARALPEGAPALIGLVGLPRSGKDLAAEHLAARYAGVRRLAFSEAIVAEANAYLEPFGARIREATKSHPPYRLLLQTFGVVRRREDEAYWVGRVAERIGSALAEGARLVIATGVRAPSDVDLIRRLGGQVWRVRRPGHESVADLHPIERMLADWPDSDFDVVLRNGVEGDASAYLADAEAAIGAAASR